MGKGEIESRHVKYVHVRACVCVSVLIYVHTSESVVRCECGVLGCVEGWDSCKHKVDKKGGGGGGAACLLAQVCVCVTA